MNNGKKEIEVDPNLLSVIQNCVTAGVNEGIKGAVKQINDQKEKSIKEKYDRKVRDTKLLLNNYRRFNKHIKQTTYTEEQLDTATVSEILDRLYILEDDEKDDITIVQAILKSKKRTEIILNHMNTILAGYEKSAYKSRDAELKRRVEVINKLYINDKKGKSFEEIAEELNTSTSTVKRDRNRAIKEIAILLFGIDGIRFD